MIKKENSECMKDLKDTMDIWLPEVGSPLLLTNVWFISVPKNRKRGRISYVHSRFVYSFTHVDLFSLCFIQYAESFSSVIKYKPSTSVTIVKIWKVKEWRHQESKEKHFIPCDRSVTIPIVLYVMYTFEKHLTSTLHYYYKMYTQHYYYKIKSFLMTLKWWTTRDYLYETNKTKVVVVNFSIIFVDEVSWSDNKRSNLTLRLYDSIFWKPDPTFMTTYKYGIHSSARFVL